ncbi:unnamed protein product [Rotaria sp. Silwood1]|nr:unnamed protein product [Rotaria sp. Silwood1]
MICVEQSEQQMPPTTQNWIGDGNGHNYLDCIPIHITTIVFNSFTSLYSLTSSSEAANSDHQKLDEALE